MSAPAGAAGTESAEMIPVIVKPESLLTTKSSVAAPTILPGTESIIDLLIKATLPNGVVLEFLARTAQTLSPPLAELAQLPC